MSRQPGAGQFGVRCYLTACQSTDDVYYYNRGSYKHYCGKCAHMLNEANPPRFCLPGKFPLCIRVEEPGPTI